MQKPKEIRRLITPFRIIIAISLGLGVSVLMILKDFDLKAYTSLNLTSNSLFYLLIAIFLMMLRDYAYMLRLWVLTDKKISWLGNFQVIMLWEFASAMTPSVVGGSAVAMFFVGKEIKNTGRATAIVLITALLDELFYVIMAPLAVLFVGTRQLFISQNFKLFGGSYLPVENIFVLGYVFILILVCIIVFGIFFKPELFKKILLLIFSRKILRRWFRKAVRMGNEIIITSAEMKDKKFWFWFKAFGFTFLSWTARFWVVNFLILAVIGGGDQLMIYARQLIMWVILLISPTPGGSGVVEYMFPKFLGEYIGGFGNEIALIWRLISYYAYLIIGSIVLTAWLKRMRSSGRFD